MCCLALMASLPIDAWIRLIGWRHHSHARRMMNKKQ
ncbi:hypothetical protein [Proteiniphilum sp. UBA5384]